MSGKITVDFTAPLEKFDEGLYLYHVKVPPEIYQVFAAQKIKRIICTYAGVSPIHNAFLSCGDHQYYIKMNKDTIKRLGVGVGDMVSVRVSEDTSRYGMTMPFEMEELLGQDPDGAELFHALTPGKIRSLLYQISTAKSADKRIEKSVIIIEHLRANNGKLDWKMLQEAWKQGL